MSSDFRLGGDLLINRIGFGAMRLPTNSFRGPARDPETGRVVPALDTVDETHNGSAFETDEREEAAPKPSTRINGRAGRG